MSSEQKQKIVFPQITDEALIAELNKQPLYIPPHETPDTYDQDMLNRGAYKTSSETVGELRPIEVAVYQNDPHKNSPESHQRVHLRIINGRHRYFTNPNWRRVYYDFSKSEEPFIAYMQARGHFDMQKKSRHEERVILVTQLCEYLNREKGIAPEECCNKAVEILTSQGIASEVSIRNACPSEYKQADMSNRKKGKTFESKGKETKQEKEIKKKLGDKSSKLEEKLQSEQQKATQLEKEKINLEKGIKTHQETIDELESKIRILGAMTNEHKCSGCGKETKISVDATSNKIVVDDKS